MDMNIKGKCSVIKDRNVTFQQRSEEGKKVQDLGFKVFAYISVLLDNCIRLSL